MFDLSSAWTSFNCPKCEYEIDIQLFDVKMARTVYCHNCKISIQLLDNDASTHAGIEQIDANLNELENLFKRF